MKGAAGITDVLKSAGLKEEGVASNFTIRQDTAGRRTVGA